MNRNISILLIWLFPVFLHAHEVRPAYLEILQLTDSSYRVSWKIPARGERTPQINPILPNHWKQTDFRAHLLIDAVHRQWEVLSRQPLHGELFYIDGLETTMIDVLVRVEMLDGEEFTQMVRPDQPFFQIPESFSVKQVILTYLWLGIEHILFGIDHLLFVLALLLITDDRRKLLKTITAFTIAHSITLSLASLDLVQIPIPPVEVIIGMSIVFLAREIAIHRPSAPSLTYRNPWLVAFLFGLLHGFGFASALTETGLPHAHMLPALACFNVGVELGQLAFVAALLIVFRLARLLPIRYSSQDLLKYASYGLGTVASFWMIERFWGFF
ncbi:HupE/UreJ family protein [Pontibacter sp. G13]|uniref:HupE/UreJ family protein n=1 Tax=Pontibacter sp. G13 TaxID=3074898 RepID=UPI00288A49A8|nr:HupE/UreJ family protein [Pontibacter sp. G13]WNJ19050.1 HupE/UreJ family protein [Pontibacter sp. G13]